MRNCRRVDGTRSCRLDGGNRRRWDNCRRFGGEIGGLESWICVLCKILVTPLQVIHQSLGCVLSPSEILRLVEKKERSTRGFKLSKGFVQERSVNRPAGDRVADGAWEGESRNVEVASRISR